MLFENLISNFIVSYPSLELRLLSLTRLPHLSSAERNSSPGESLLSPQMCYNIRIYLKLHSIGTSTQNRARKTPTRIFLTQPSPKTPSELQMSSIPVTVSNTDKLLLFQKLTQNSCVPLGLSPHVSRHTNNKKTPATPSGYPAQTSHPEYDAVLLGNRPATFQSNNAPSTSRVWRSDFPYF